MPLLWTAVSFVALGQVNPGVREGIEWPWFVLSQFVFGVVAAIVFMRFESRSPILAGLFGGVAGGLLDAHPGDSLEPRRRAWHLVSGQFALGDGVAPSRRAVARGA